MKKKPFKKFQGTGNDFVIIDNRSLFFDKEDINQIQFICSRKFGVGADGLILIEDHQKLDFNMVFFNPDGSQSFCGNGSRCAVQFAYDLGIINKQTVFLSTDGTHEASILENNVVKLKMNDVSNIEQNANFDFMNTGSPHYVAFTSNVVDLDILKKGSEIRYSDSYKSIGGTNVNFIEAENDFYNVRTYERGVENETLSCGTGVTACALSIGIKYNLSESKIKIKTKGGNLTVDFKKDKKNNFTDIWLSGPATFVFDGAIELKY